MSTVPRLSKMEHCPCALPCEPWRPQTRQSSLCSCLLQHSERGSLIQASIADPFTTSGGGDVDVQPCPPLSQESWCWEGRGIELNAACSAPACGPSCPSFVPCVPICRTAARPCAHLQHTNSVLLVVGSCLSRDCPSALVPRRARRTCWPKL